MKSKYIPLLIIIALIIGGIFFFFRSNLQTGNSSTGSGNGNLHVVTLGENGFDPENITIKRGDSIEFKTTLDKHFWPASDIHPTHGIYPEFDPQDAIAPDKTWTFKFGKVGKWNYHDHLSPYYTGTVTVE
jgi:plastocyanin